MIAKHVDINKATEFGKFIKEKTSYEFVYKSLAGIFNGVDPWIGSFDFSYVLENIDDTERTIVSFFLLGNSSNAGKLEAAIGKNNLSFLLESGYAIQRGVEIEPNNYVLLPIMGKLFVVNPPYRRMKSDKKIPILYVGSDSLKLISYVNKRHDLKVMDLCSGAGILGLSLIDFCSSVDFVELREDVINALYFNLYINDVEMDKVNVIQSDLFDNIKDNRYDYILNNPPFVPVPDGEFLPDCGAGGEDGLLLVRRILEKADQYLNPNGRLYMVLESIGNFEKPVVIEEFERYFRQGIVNVALLNRQIIEAQAMVSARASSQMNNNPQRERELYEKWMNMFHVQNVSYVYPTMIEYVKTGTPLRVNIVNNYEKENRDLCFSLAENVKIEPFDKRMFRLKNGSDRSVVIDEEVRELIGNGEPKAFEDFIRNDYMNYFNKLKLLQYLQQHDVIRFI